MGGIMLKKYVITVCVLSMLFIAACDRKSVNDIYSMQSESSSYEQQTSDKENKVISKGYLQCTQDDKPLLIAQGDEYTAISNGSRKQMLTFKINQSLLTDNFNTLKDITDENMYNVALDYILNIDDNNEICADGEVNTRKGIAQKIVIIDMSITNENDYEQNFYTNSLTLYSIKDADSTFQYRRVEGFNDFILQNNYENKKKSNIITLQSHESKEIIDIRIHITTFFHLKQKNSPLFTPFSNEWMNEYTSYKGADNNILFKDVVLEEVPFDSIYITTQFDGMYSNGNKKGFELNKALLKLDLMQ